MALCSLSTGSTVDAARAAPPPSPSCPAMTRISLFASAMRLAGVDRREHGVEAGGAGRGEQHHVGVGMGRHRDQALGAAARGRRHRHATAPELAAKRRDARPRSTSRRSTAHDARPARPAASRCRRRRGRRRATDRDARRRPPACCGRSIRSSRGRRCGSSDLQVPHEDVIDRAGEQPAVDAIEDAAVAGNQRRRVLDAGASLEQRLEQIADDAEQRPPRRRSTSSASGAAGNTQSRARDHRHRCRTTTPPMAPSTRLLRADRRRQRRRPKARPV